jgi:hypothetical protein
VQIPRCSRNCASSSAGNKRRPRYPLKLNHGYRSSTGTARAVARRHP